MNENGKIKLEYCPICGNKNYRSGLCPVCGYDLSKDYTRFPTVGKIPANTKGPEALRAEYLKKQQESKVKEDKIKLNQQIEQLQKQQQEIEERLNYLNNQKKQAEIQEKPVVKKSDPKKPKKPMIIAAAVAGVVLVGGIAFGLHLSQNAAKSSTVSDSTGVASEAATTSVSSVSQVDSDETAGAPGFAGAEVGDTVVFGSYEQDDDTSNGKEDIEWRVLDKEDDRILVISEYALDCQQYNEEDADVTWETCSLREWLNSTFLEQAFSSDEMSYIPEVTVTADTNPEYDTDPGNDTEDQVFLLSCSEAEEYFSSDEDRMCVPTAYAISQGAWTDDYYSVGGSATCRWWLRSPGYDSDDAANVFGVGSVFSNGDGVDYDYFCVRPALWINIDETSGSEKVVSKSESENTDSAETTTTDSITPMEEAGIGDTVVFGSYEQDDDTSNGKEDIEWRVLDKEDDRILIISKYALDCQQYNEESTDVTWETCSLREWLNGTFLEEAFSSDEMSYIPEVTVTADTNPYFNTDSGNDTEDQVFLLSCSEAEEYFSSDEDRMCVPTAYAISQGAYTNDDYSVGGLATCWWWLRSPGYGSNLAASVDDVGSLSYNGHGVVRGDLCVRPALWVNL